MVIDAARRIYVSTSAALAAFDASGAELWSVPVEGASIPMIAVDGNVVAVTQSGHAIEAFAPDGASRWTFTLDATPVVSATTDGRIVVVSAARDALTAVEPTGELAWSWADPEGGLLGPIATATPDGYTVVMRQDGAVVVLGSGGALLQIYVPGQFEGGVTPDSVATAGPSLSLAWCGGDEWTCTGGTLTSSAKLYRSGVSFRHISIYTFDAYDGPELSVVAADGASTSVFSFLDNGFVGGFRAAFPGTPNGGELLSPDATGYVSTSEGVFAVDRYAKPLFGFPSMAGGASCGAAAIDGEGVLYVACGGALYALG